MRKLISTAMFGLICISCSNVTPSKQLSSDPNDYFALLELKDGGIDTIRIQAPNDTIAVTTMTGELFKIAMSEEASKYKEKQENITLLNYNGIKINTKEFMDECDKKVKANVHKATDELKKIEEELKKTIDKAQ